MGNENVRDNSEAAVRDRSREGSEERQATGALQEQANDIRKSERPAAVAADDKSLGLPSLSFIDTTSGARDLFNMHQGSVDKKAAVERVDDVKSSDQKVLDPSKSVETGVDPSRKTDKKVDAAVEPDRATDKTADKTTDKTTDKTKHLTEAQEKDGLVQSKEGPYQVAERLLGKSASQEEKMALVKAMRSQYNEETGNKDPHMKSLSVGRSLLNEQNYDKVIANIKDEALQKSVIAKLEQKQADAPKKAEPKQDEPKKEEPKVEPKKEEPKVAPKKEDPKDSKAEPGKDAPKPEKAEPVEQKLGPLGSKFVPVTEKQPVKSTIASVYSSGHTTASTRHFNPNEPTVAIKPEVAKAMGLRFGDVIKITRGDKSTEAVYTDAGPFVRGRAIDLSTSVGRKLGITVDGIGVAPVTFEKIGREPGFMGHTKRKRH